MLTSSYLTCLITLTLSFYSIATRLLSPTFQWGSQSLHLRSHTSKRLRCYMVKSHGQLVLVSSTHYCAFTPSLSTSSSPTDLQESCDSRDLILGQASRLDAFSGYLFRTQLPGNATGVTTGTPEVRSLRSSRTRSNSPQISNAHGRQGPNCLTTF